MKTWNIVFLLDQNPPTKIVFLKRASSKKFAPGMYTGIGGKVEEGETPIDSAYRELKEETGLTNIHLKQLAEVIIDEKEKLVYFWGKYTDTLPISDDGTLEWISTNEILNKKIIPTTLEMLKRWQDQGFSTLEFTLQMKTISEENGIKKVKLLSSS